MGRVIGASTTTGIANDDLDAEGNLPEENKPTPNDSVDLLLDSLETAGGDRIC